MIESRNMAALVAALPEKYQPIFGHPELSDGCSRSCEDRLVLIRRCASQFQAILGRPLRVLDLGCAQGFFSLSLAADGHHVHGVDFLDLNVDVCQTLAKEHPAFDVAFEHATVEDVIDRLEPGDYDLVLGLSVFHHLVHARGLVSVSELCRRLSEVACVGIYELALREEPLYWAPSLPNDPAELLSSYAFIRLLSRQETHLSSISRPLFFASSRYWYVGDSAGEFTSWSAESHVHGRGTHQHSRRYYFGEGVFVKKMTLGIGGRAEINLQEFENEVSFLREPPARYPAPRLIAELNDSSDLFLVREMKGGRLISELIDDGVPYDADSVVSELLEQLVILEKAGLYHNDVRCWNVVMSPEGRAILIDYGAISANAEDCSWLGDPLLSFLITTKEILGREIVPASPGREPALDFMSLPPRYRNAFIRLFDQDQVQWNFVELQRCLADDAEESIAAPKWISIYKRMQEVLLSYNTRLGALYTQAGHDRVELAACAAGLERVREAGLRSQEELASLRLELEAAETRYQELERDRLRLAEWAKELEAQALKAGCDSESMAARSAEFERSSANLAARIEELEQEVKDRQQVLVMNESLGIQVGRLNEECAALQAALSVKQAQGVQQETVIGKLQSVVADRQRRLDELDAANNVLQGQVSEGRRIAGAYMAKAEELQAKIASLQRKFDQVESSRAHDRRRLKDLQLDLPQRMQLVESSRQRIRDLEMTVGTLEQQVAGFYASRSWRITAPLRWFSTRVLGRPSPQELAPPPKSVRNEVSAGEELSSPVDAIVDRKLAALNQLASRIRRS